MVRLSYLAAFLGICGIIQASSVAPRSDAGDTTIRRTIVTSMFETIVRHPTGSRTRKATKTATRKPPKTLEDKGASTETSLDQDSSVIKSFTTSDHSETSQTSAEGEAAPSLTTGSSRTSGKGRSSTSSAQSQPDRTSDDVAARKTSTKTKTLVTSTSGRTASATDGDVPPTSTSATDGEDEEDWNVEDDEDAPSATTVDKKTTKIANSTGTGTETTSPTSTQQPSDEADGAKILPPSQDPWYQAPDNFGVTPRGQLIKRRKTPGNLTSMLKNLDKTDQLMYRYNGTWGEPTWGVTTVLSPKKNDFSKPNVVTYQAAYHSANIDGSPSYLLSTGSDVIEWHVLDRMLEQGWYVSVTDYEGPSASFGAGKMAGHAVLDAMQVFNNIAGTLYDVDFHHIRHIGWGYSGGALATAWAYHELRSYSYDMQNVFYHYVIGGFPVDTFDMIKRLDGHEDAGVALHALSGLMTEFRHVNGTIQLAAKTSGPFNITVFDRVKTMTHAETKTEFARQNISDYFVDGLDHAIGELRGHQPPEQNIDFPKKQKLASHLSANVRPRRVVLVYHAVNDEVAPIQKVDELIKKGHWCRSGVVVDYHRSHNGDHRKCQELALDTVINWMKIKFRVMQFWSHEGGTMDTVGETEHFKKQQCDIFQQSWVEGESVQKPEVKPDSGDKEFWEEQIGRDDKALS